jgi:prepilin-type N-terminal cleavage/methylation domain-containing protein
MSEEMNRKDNRMTRPLSIKTFHRTKAFSLIEMMVAIAIVAIPILAVGILLSGASRGWEKIYEDTNSPVRQDAMAIMASLQNFGRQANICNYQVYTIKTGVYAIAVPPNGQTTAIGQAVEFRYWQDTFNPAAPAANLLDTNNTGTHYTLYYLDGTELKVDFGKVVNGIGGVNGGARQTANIISSQTLARDVDLVNTTQLFSHTVVGGQGNGCINTELTLTNVDKISIEIKFATMLRAAWPR